MSFNNQISNYGSYQYVVSGTGPGPYPTITDAINQALADGFGPGNPIGIFVQPGTYTENLVFDGGINIIGTTDGTVNITGTHTPALTGSIGIYNCTLTSATDLFGNTAVASSDILIQNCIFNIDGIIYNLPNWSGILSVVGCTDVSTSCAVVDNTAGAVVNISYSEVGVANANTFSGLTSITHSTIEDSLCLGSADVTIDNCIVNGQLVNSETANLSIYNSRIESPAHSCIVTTSTGNTIIKDCILDTSDTYVIAGTGAIELGSATFDGTFTFQGTITAANLSLFQASNVNILNTLSLNGSQGTAGEVLTSQGAATAPVWAPVGGGGMTWVAAPADTSFTVNQGVYNTKATLLTMTLPVTAVAGTVIAIQGTAVGAAGWIIAQNAGQNIQVGDVSSTIGVGGSVASTDANDGITLLCTVADTTWNEVGMVGNLTIV